MNYSEFLTNVYQRYSGNVKLGLERMTGILADMQHPEQRLNGVHIGGTNGKGSTCAACEALSLAHGLHTGLNTSPHLIDFCERFRVDGQNARFETVLEIFHRYEDIFTRWEASFFEITTAIAFQLLVERDVQQAIIEVGLGGRLDATNLFTPRVSVITTIGLDHVKTLGDTLELIAYEKAGIIKTGIPLVLGRIADAPKAVILRQAREKNAPVYQIDKDFTIANVVNSRDGICFDYTFGTHQYKALRTNLLGKHQAVNISTALTAFILYSQATGLTVDEHHVRFALRNVHWMGRMQLVHRNPTVIVDGAHNQQGIDALVENLTELFPQQKLLFVISILEDKDYVNMLRRLCPLAKCFYISKNESDRAAEIDAQADVVRQLGIPVQTAPSVLDAFNLALSDADKEDVIIGGGSLYTVGEILQATR